MAPMYYRGAKAAICVFDVTNEESFDRIMNWLRDLKNHADPNVVICIAGNKCDKEANFDLKRCEEYAQSVGANFFQTSARTGTNVDAIFNTLSSRIFEVYHDKLKPAADSSSSSSVKRLQDSEKSSTPASSGCC